VTAPERNEQLIRRGYAAFNAEGVSAAAELLFDPEVEYADDAVWPGGGTHKGRAAVVARFEEVAESLGVTQAAVERVVARGDRLAWTVRFSGRSPSADVPNEHTWGYVGRIARGKVVRFRACYDPQEALDALEREA
jgi:ketosteroid isomerase-like protein